MPQTSQISTNLSRFTRQSSIADENINIDQFLKISNYEDTVRQLDTYYGMGKKVSFIKSPVPTETFS